MSSRIYTAGAVVGTAFGYALFGFTGALVGLAVGGYLVKR